MTVIERSAVIEVLVAANGEGFREFYEKDATYGHPAVDRAMVAAEPLAEQLRGAVEGWERVDLLASWIDRDKRESDKVLAYAQELVRLAMRHGGGR